MKDDVFDQPPETLRGVAREYVLGAYKREGQLLLMLDIQRTLTARMV